MEKQIFIAPDVAAIRAAVEALLAVDVSNEAIGVLANDSVSIEDLPVAVWWQPQHSVAPPLVRLHLPW